jgi:hypothetical protein
VINKKGEYTMDFRLPGLTARLTTNSMTGVVRRDPNGFSTNVSHLRTDEPAQYETRGLQKPSYLEINWKEFSDHVMPYIKTGRAINVTIVTWDNGDRGNTGNYTPVNDDNGEITMMAGLSSIDPITKTFTVTNSLNQAGEGMSGGIALLEIGGDTFEIGQLHGIVDGKLDSRDQLRFVRSDSSDIESFHNDIETNHKKKKKGKAQLERHDHGINVVTTNRKSAELKAQKSTADKHKLQQRGKKETRQAEKAEAREKHKAKAHKK